MAGQADQGNPESKARPGQRRMARDCIRQIAGFIARVAVLNGFTAHGIAVTKAVQQVRLGKEALRPSADLGNRAADQ